MGCCEGIESLVTSLLFKLRIINHIYLKIQRLYFTIFIIVIELGAKKWTNKSSAFRLGYISSIGSSSSSSSSGSSSSSSSSNSAIVLVFLVVLFLRSTILFHSEREKFIVGNSGPVGLRAGHSPKPILLYRKMMILTTTLRRELDWRGFLSDTPLMFGQLPT